MKPRKITKALLYNEFAKEGFVLPKSTSTICNLAYLFRVRNGIEYCPMENEVSNLFCHSPPKRMLLLLYIEEQLEKNNDMRTISFDEKHLPDVDWCLKAMSALDPLNMIFDPDYKPPSNHRGRRGIRYVPTAEDLFNLDEISKKSNESDKKTKSQKETCLQWLMVLWIRVSNSDK